MHGRRGTPRYDPFQGALVEATLVRRYKRFLADMILADGREVTAHCPNSGSMMGMNAPGSACLLQHVPSPKRKLHWTWEFVRAGAWVGVNTVRPNRIVSWAIEQGALSGLPADSTIRHEVPFGDGSRVDLVVQAPAGPVHVEVKNTTLADGRVARFPDAVTARGAKHMTELAHVVETGGRAAAVFLVNRADCDRFEFAADIDPAFHQAALAARDAGVGLIALGVDGGPAGWAIRGVLPVTA